jgi:hypothetical protein
MIFYPYASSHPSIIIPTCLTLSLASGLFHYMNIGLLYEPEISHSPFGLHHAPSSLSDKLSFLATLPRASLGTRHFVLGQVEYGHNNTIFLTFGAMWPLKRQPALYGRKDSAPKDVSGPCDSWVQWMGNRPVEGDPRTGRMSMLSKQTVMVVVLFPRFVCEQVPSFIVL